MRSIVNDFDWITNALEVLLQFCVGWNEQVRIEVSEPRYALVFQTQQTLTVLLDAVSSQAGAGDDELQLILPNIRTFSILFKSNENLLPWPLCTGALRRPPATPASGGSTRLALLAVVLL